jgi:hypothetical protein
MLPAARADAVCMTATARQYSTIEKLLAPEVGAMETVSRALRDAGYGRLADRVMAAKQRYVDECAEIRRQFRELEDVQY